jgi:hypothetical protein
MGWDAQNSLPAGTRLVDVFRLLQRLGYRRTGATTLHDVRYHHLFLYDDRNLEHLSGISADVTVADDKCIWVHTRTTIWRSKTDSELHNLTIRELRSRFGGKFTTDAGPNTYLRFNGVARRGAEAGCYRAFARSRNAFTSAQVYLMSRNFTNAEFLAKAGDLVPIDMNPELISNNMLLPFVVAGIEEYFKSSYVALLRHSERRSTVLKTARLSTDEMIQVADDQTSIEDAVARRMSFQNIYNVSSAFKEVDPKLDIAGALKRPFRRRKESVFSTFDRFFSDRHELIHRNALSPFYNTPQIKKDLNTLQEGIRRTYREITTRYNWIEEDS